MPEVIEDPTEQPEPATPDAEPAQPVPPLILIGAEDAPTCTDGVCL
ncbi:hypothetical protein [Actinoplanes utahensis]|nr:hypothetical protein [Actinoplanes utahensis]